MLNWLLLFCKLGAEVVPVWAACDAVLEGCCQGGFMPLLKVWKSATLCFSGIPSPSPRNTTEVTGWLPKRCSAPWQLCFLSYGLLYYFDDISRPCKLCATIYYVHCRIQKIMSHCISFWVQIDLDQRRLLPTHVKTASGSDGILPGSRKTRSEPVFCSC